MITTEGQQVVQAVLLCSSSDVPATRKVGGFVGHGALKGCLRCLRNQLGLLKTPTIVALIQRYGLNGRLRSTYIKETNGSLIARTQTERHRSEGIWC